MAMSRECWAPEGGATILRFPVRQSAPGGLSGSCRAVSARSLRVRRSTYVRRRLAVLGAGALLVVSGIVATGPSGRAVASRPDAPSSVVVGPGTTLWSLAGRYAPDGIDPRAYVDALAALNDLRGAPQIGQRLRLPG